MVTLEEPAAGMPPLAAGIAEALPLPRSTAGSENGGLLVQRCLQRILDDFRSTDIAAARERQDQQVGGWVGAYGTGGRLAGAAAAL